ncbi:hypothetical protein CC85DRAFT_289444 [Cutaneotrichosporon oleaginosum]|uniref:Polysaccharide lyase 14 domain-containing protein n=1 Tax=Cutaneotrichosporon oleaginosum TaxID=879819 RepID=A0A0J0XBT4_9TREE|nr:uncharacterized protein CC85DRAFT_289444 [Cutaneotrichosporon oleaginosum]KLT38525.1 hypothetical protein CC85DRAFT_289444 [Cutaneotrichosporon oleaginosum]TXT14696.1 hypothetical protein COLE_00889 [Cutaneotrichosporon oleaginosum]
MRFQLLSVLAVLASASVEASQPQARDIVNQAGPGVARSFDRPHGIPRRSRSRHGKRKTCRARPVTSEAAAVTSEAVSTTSEAVPATTSTPADSNSFASEEEEEGASSPSSASSAPASASASASPSASTDGAASEDAFEEAEASSPATTPAKPAATAQSGSDGQVNTATKVLAGGVDKWIGTLAPEQGPVGSAIQTFTTGGGDSGVTLIDIGGGQTKRGSFEDMTIEGNNDGLKDAYGRLRRNGDGSVTFTYRQGQVNDHDSWFYYTTADPGNSGMDLTAARTASFTYTVKFQEGFDWKLGGKLPGWYGGDSAESGKHCTGHAASSSCFSSRLMWRPDGVGEVYNYYWGSQQAYCSNPASYKIGTAAIICHGGSGDSLGRGAFKFEAGKAVTITNTITLNTMNGNSPNEDGKQVIVVDGVKVIEANNLVLRHHDQGRIRGLFFSTFFGGSGSSWASPKDQEATFSDFTVSVLEKL